MMYLLFLSKDKLWFIINFSLYQSNKTHVDHQAMAYIAPKKIISESNGGNENKPVNGTTTNSVNGTTKTTKKFPKWGGAEICPRCDKSVNIHFSLKRYFYDSPAYFLP